MPDRAAINYSSPIGTLTIHADGGFITSIIFGETPDATSPAPVLSVCTAQLDEYFRGARKTFDLPLSPTGTAFRKRVWDELVQIPYGETRSYKEIAAALGNPKASRAVGGANHHNPIPIIIPCHRVIGADGGMTGYAGELWRKEWLLGFEKTGGN